MRNVKSLSRNVEKYLFFLEKVERRIRIQGRFQLETYQILPQTIKCRLLTTSKLRYPKLLV